MPLYEIRPLQLRILKNLQAVDAVCKARGLRYYIWAGTMIGAIRHKGFIPWDGDHQRQHNFHYLDFHTPL